jgi:hypothetical protein
MKDQNPSDRAAGGGERQDGDRADQPWHADDEKPASRPARSGAPIGTHSLTGGAAEVGLPSSPEAAGTAERSSPRDMPPGAPEPDPLAEPRANVGEILGRKP